MLGNNQEQRIFKDLPCDDDKTQQQEPFDIVLVDIRWACRYKEIKCIKKPLESTDLKFVAISYRWGELDETVIDTGVGYTATIKSFDLNDFYKLCRTIYMEVDMQDMDYMWIDAICVNQTDYDQRKNTIYHMSDIYEHATYILAVPDLHKAHLMNVSTQNTKIMDGSYNYQNYIYHLIHGDKKKLAQMESEWLDTLNIPDDPALRTLLTTSTDHFMDGFMTYRKHYNNYDPVHSVHHILETVQPVETYPKDSDYHTLKENYNLMDSLDRLHSCHQDNCPLDLYDTNLPLPSWRRRVAYLGRNDRNQWVQRIYERSVTIRQSIQWMSDLIKDWSTRVWTGKTDLDNVTLRDYIATLSCHLVYLIFHKTMLIQLTQQTLFEMLLKSKASKHEDRFYAILPITEYKNKIGIMNDENLKMDSLVSVKLKMFEWMNTKDKLELLFLFDRNYTTIAALPSFATTTINWYEYNEFFPVVKDVPSPYNFDMSHSSSAILLYQDNDLGMPYLNLKPKVYYVDSVSAISSIFINHAKVHTDRLVNEKLRSWNHLQPNGDSDSNFNNNVLVWIPDQTDVDVGSDTFDAGSICLYGNFEQNIWMLVAINHFGIFGSAHHTIDDHHIGFNIY